jgi:hypothetical protein
MENGPVYIYHDGEIDRRGFREAGFRIVHVEGILYELVPPRGGPHSGEKGAS